MTRRKRWLDEDALQHQLRDLLCLATVADHVRWVVVDDPGLCGWLADAATQWRGWADQAAAQLVQSQTAPDGRIRSLAKDIPENWVPDGWLSGEAARCLIAGRLGRVVDSTRYRLSQADEDDRELLGSVTAGLEAQLAACRKGELFSEESPNRGGPVWGIASEELNATLLEWRAGEGPAEHVNEERDVLLAVLVGSAVLRTDDDERELVAGEATIIAKGTQRKISAGRDGVRYLSVHRRRPPLQITRASRRDT
jgi:quercetin dioxygenase-like cupin family protein